MVRCIENPSFHTECFQSLLHPQTPQVELEECNGGGGGMRRVPLTVQGLTPGGYLLATDAAGAAFELHPDGNRHASMAKRSLHGI